MSPVKGLSFLLKIVKNLSSLSEKIVFIVVGSVHSTQKRYYNYLLNNINKLGIKIFFLGEIRCKTFIESNEYLCM